MKVRELIKALECFDGDMEVRIGMIQSYGSNFAMDVDSVDEYNINAWDEDDFSGVVITEGSQMGTVDYSEDY